MIGQRGLSVADQASFGSRTETFTWDAGGNHKGYLRYWQSFAPSTSTASVTLDVGNNNQGQRTLTEHRLNIAGYPQLIRQHLNYYWLFGGLRQTRFYDAVTPGGNATVANYAYDARLLPSLITLTRGGEPSLNIAQQTRNVAGLVTKRRTNTTGAMTFVESNWTYDKLGRVVDQVVQKGPGPTQVARQSLSYFGNDDPATLDHYLGTTQRHFVYGYDLRHQLTSAVETTTPGYYASSYHYGSPTSAGRFSRAVEAQTIAVAGSEVKPRDVTYFYNGADPEQVTHLRITNSNTAYATYTYDAVGNQTSRCLGPNTSPCTGELLEYVYDGKDQLRRVTKKVNGAVTGSEEYWYQAEGHRVAIVKRDSAGTKTELVSFIGDTQAHYDPSGAITHVYSHPSLGTPVARVDRTSNTSTSLEFQFHGLSNSTLVTVGSNGTMGAVLAYTPYGTTLEANEGLPGALASQARRHNDKFTDEVSGLVYYGVRYLDRTTATWTSTDPAYRFDPDRAGVEPRRASLYTLNLGNPLRYVDPDGRNSRVAATIQATQGLPVPARAIAVGAAALVTVTSGVIPCQACAFAEALLQKEAARQAVARENARRFVERFKARVEEGPPPPVETTSPKDPRDPMKKGDKPFNEPYPDDTPAPGTEGDWPPVPWDPQYPTPPFPPWPGWPKPPTSFHSQSMDEVRTTSSRRGSQSDPAKKATMWTDSDESSWMYRENRRGDLPLEAHRPF